MNFSNEPGLRKRLVELTDKYLNILSSLIGDPKDFVDKVASTRDYHTHFNEDIMGRAAIKGKDFHELIGPLKIILEASLLESLGFTIKEIEKLFKNKS